MASAPFDFPFSSRLFKAFFKLDDSTTERSLFFARPAIDKESWLRPFVGQRKLRKGVRLWRTRLKAWEHHLDEYDKIANLPRTTLSGAHRIDQLNILLGVLDSKIGMSLGFNSLLLSGVGLFLTWVPSLVEHARNLTRAHVFLVVFRIIVLAILGVLLTSLTVLLRGFRRVVWGDLSREELAEGTLPKDEERLPKKEKEYSRFLIISLARRTNIFRISTYLTKWALRGLAVVIALSMVVSIAAPFWHADETVGTGNVSIEVNRSNVQMDREPPPAAGKDSGTKSVSGATSSNRRHGCKCRKNKLGAKSSQ
jgi:hypothetical protein